jgi:hypothetical protein
MDDAEYTLTPSQVQSFWELGYLRITGFLSKSESSMLQKWAQEVHDLPRTEDAPWMPYEVSFKELK